MEAEQFATDVLSRLVKPQDQVQHVAVNFEAGGDLPGLKLPPPISHFKGYPRRGYGHLGYTRGTAYSS